jgi:protein tyrosine/serine phosphatase
MRLSPLLAVIVLSVGTGIFSSAQSAQDAQPSASAESSQAADASRFTNDVTKHPELPNFHEVHPYLFRSGAPNEVGLQEAKDKGVNTVIDLRNPGEIKKKGDEQLWAERLGIKYVSMPMGPHAPSKGNVDRFLKLVDEAKQNNKAVLVHCAHGSDRTGCLIGIWRVDRDGWDYDKTYDEMRHYWFSPKYTELSGTVKKYSHKSK